MRGHHGCSSRQAAAASARVTFGGFGAGHFYWHHEFPALGSCQVVKLLNKWWWILHCHCKFSPFFVDEIHIFQPTLRFRAFRCHHQHAGCRHSVWLFALARPPKQGPHLLVSKGIKCAWPGKYLEKIRSDKIRWVMMTGGLYFFPPP